MTDYSRCDECGTDFADVHQAIDHYESVCPKELAELRGKDDELTEAKANLLACAEAIGVVYTPEGHANHPGPIDEIVGAIRGAASDSGQLIDAQNDLTAAKATIAEKQFALDAANETIASLKRDLEYAAAYVQDRSEQYKNSSGCRAALEDVASNMRRGEHLIAGRHGELDDLLARTEPKS